jgi:uncharacterized protein with FMN-binding domain
MAGRAPLVLAATATGVAALLNFHPHRVAPTVAGTSAATAGTGTAYTSAVEPTRYGNVQVRITVSGGKVTGISTVQIPAGDPRSSQISSWAEPVLREEALTAQNASIDFVSGATYTSEGYRAALASALQRAGVA